MFMAEMLMEFILSISEKPGRSSNLLLVSLLQLKNARDVCAVALAQSSKEQPPHAQRAVLKFAKYTKCRAVAGRFTPGTFTNQIQAAYFEPRVLIASDPLKDHQPIMESSYCNMPVIAFANTNANMKHVDIAIPCNTDGKHSIALMYWMLTREVLRLRGEIPRNTEWDVMVDMFVYRDPEEPEKADEGQKAQPFNSWAADPGADPADYPDAQGGAGYGQDGDWGTANGEWGANPDGGFEDS